MAELDEQTESLVKQLYNAWSTNADSSSYLTLRDQVLIQRERVDTCISTLKTVISVTCPRITETERYVDPKWEELFALAESIESSAEAEFTLGKRKRTYNEVHRLRNLAVVSALWSPSVVRHYEWNTAGQGCLRLLKTCALRFPHFGTQFCPHLNRVLLDRHCEAILSGRLKTLNEAPLQCHRDLNILASGGIVPDRETEELWVTSSDGTVPVDSNGNLLKDVRPHHVQQHLLCRDRYGMLVARGEYQDPPEIVDQQPEYSLSPSTFEQLSAPDDGHLAGVPGWTISPADLFTPLEVDSILESLASSYQTEALPDGLVNTSTLTLPGNDAVDLALATDRVPISGYTLSSHASERDDAESDDTSVVSDVNSDVQNSTRSPQDIRVHSLSRSTKAARLAARPARPRGRNGASDDQLRGEETVEDELRNRHKQTLSIYIDRLSEEATPGYDQRQLRSQWLTPDTKWARIWSVSGRKSLPPGTATSKAKCDVLYYSADRFLEAARSGEAFQKPVVIKDSFSDAEMHSYERFLSLLEDSSSSDEQVEVRCIDIKGPMHERLAKFTAYLRSRPEQIGPLDGLWMSTARSIAKCHRPLFTMLTRFRLLESLSEGLYDPRSSSAPSPLLRAMSVSFNTISFPGAFSGPSLNTAAGSWQRNLSGVKLWVFIPEPEVPLDGIAVLAGAENEQLPQGKQRLVVLEENDVLFVPPGLRLVQAWHSPRTCLTEQGMLWDDLSILSVVESMKFGRDNQVVQDDHTSYQLPRMINNLDRLIREHPDRFRRSMARDEFLDRFREACQSWLLTP
ncbi:hypothetical protein PRZ48_006567 [Zasmidium cellare]|uniref:Uncharacterized protein n=1 Tax=Zasmidium cellare TaxID=395010 RepID=A0ABR0EPG5_ZASCE|nr:hypothetical protein PRZ48_006567 [Zasmidium cellare]